MCMSRRTGTPRLPRQQDRRVPHERGLMNPLEAYLHEMQEIRSYHAGVKETSYYPALRNLLNAVGKTLKPPVHCIINLKNQGAGMPDGGLFTPDQKVDEGS